MSNNFQTIESSNPNFPGIFSELKQPVNRFYLKGNVSLLNTECIAVIGSRKMTAYGALLLKLFIPALVKYGLTIVSGLAYGVDSAAHKLALEYGGRCLAVLGSSLDNIYPACHFGLSEAIVNAGGAVITEYQLGSRIYKYCFAERNRIIAALSKVLLIIEASENSGTLITARYALDCGKEVCVVPSDITRVESRGVNSLLKQGARPVTEPNDVLSLFGSVSTFQATLPLSPALTGTTAIIYDLIYQGYSNVGQLVTKSDLAISFVQGALAILELDGYIYRDENNWKIRREK